jgi:shikimate kinase
VNITVIGYRGTGKSTVARLVANRLGWTWIDADAYLEKLAGLTIHEIFAREGEAGFRAREAAVIAELTARHQLVIATGGGAVLRAENRQAIRACGFTVWLVASPAIIAQRIAADPTSASRRPALTGSDPLTEIRQLLDQREPLYRRCADLVVDTERQSPDQIAQLIVQAAAAPRRSIPTE